MSVQRLVGAERGGEQNPLGDAVLEFEVVALPEELAFFLLLERSFLVVVLLGLFPFGLGKAPMDGAAIFELDLALLDLGFLDFEFGQSRLGGADRQPKCRQRRNRSRQHQVLRAAQPVQMILQEPSPDLSLA